MVVRPDEPRKQRRVAVVVFLVLGGFLLYDEALGAGHISSNFGSSEVASPGRLVTAVPGSRRDTPSAKGDDEASTPVVAVTPKVKSTPATKPDAPTAVATTGSDNTKAEPDFDSVASSCPQTLCPPFLTRAGSLYVQLTPDGVREPQIFRTGAMFQDPAVGPQPFYSFPEGVENIIIDVGTNMDPDSITDFWSNSSMGFLWFEPQKTLLTHPYHLPETRRTISLETNRVVAYPAAVAPTNGMMKLYISAVHGCTSLLPMNPKALEDPSVMQNSFKGGDRTFQDYSTSKIGFVNCVKKGDREFDWVPTVRGLDVAKMIHPKYNIVYLSVDAQGFDMQVAASFGQQLKRAHILLLECQDLPPGHGMFLTKGAFSCAEIKHCIESNLPHRMIAGATGEIADTCTINNPSEERNCLFRLMDKPYFNMNKLPYLIQRAAHKLRYGIRENLECPRLDVEA